MAEMLNVQVCYALPERQELISVKLADGGTIRQAIEASGVLAKYPDLAIENCKVGIFGKLGKLDTLVREQDRIEIYRPLIADPKEVRKQRAAEGKVMKKGSGETEEA